jgi:hypothetical protein
MAKTTDELFAEATEADYETAEPVTLAASDTEEEFQFRIDEHLRTIAIPEKGVVAGVEGDLNVNIARFTMTRYYHGRDLSKLNIRINYRNANGQVNYYTVSDATVSGDSIVFSWEFAADVTQYKGNVQFVVYLFSATNAVLKQRFFTTLGTLEVLEGLEVDSSIPVSEQTDILLHLKKDLSAYAEEVKKSLPADYTAMTEQVSSLKEDLDDLNESIFAIKGKENLSWAIGAVNKADGLAVAVNNRIRCKIFQADGGSVSVSDGYQIGIGVYNGNNLNQFDHYVDFSRNEYHFEKGKYYVIVIRANSEVSFVNTDIANVLKMITLKYWNGDDKVDQNTKNIESIYSNIDSIKEIGLSSKINFSTGGLNPSDGSITDNAERLHSDIIFVRKGSTIKLKPNKKIKFAVYKYGDLLGNEFISATALSFDDYIFTDDYYIRILIESGDTTLLKDIDFDLFSFDLNELNNRVKYTELTEWVNKGYIPISEVNDYTKFVIKYTTEWSFMVLPVHSGDKFIVHGYGGIGSRLYTFTDRFGKVLIRTEKTNVMQKLVITSPSDGYVIFNVLRGKEHQVIKFNTNVIIKNDKRNLIVPPYIPSAYNPILSVPNNQTSVMNYEEIMESWNNLQKKYPNYISKTNLGKETSGILDMYRYDFIPEIVPLEASVQDGMNKIYTKNDYPIVIMGACIHGAERPCAKALLNLMTLIADAKDYSILGWLRNNIHFVIIPLENPWGYKNNKRTNVNQVDLNRNFEPYWEKGDNTTENQRYRGTAPLSEKEAQYIDSILKECADKAVCYYSFHTHGVFTSYSMMTNFSSPALFLLNDMQNIGMSVTKMITTSGWTNHNLPEDSGYIGCMEMAYGVAMASYQGAKYNIPSACPEVMYRYYDGGTGEVYNTDLDCMNTEYILYAVANACKKFLYGN